MQGRPALAGGNNGFGSGFPVLAYAVQFFFGGWFFYNGINYFAGFTAAPPGSTSLSRELIGALEDTGLFAVVKGVELVTGGLLLANRFVPLAIVLAAPVSFAIAWVMLVINGGIAGSMVGMVMVLFTAVLVCARLESFLPLLAFDDAARRRAAFAHLPRLSPAVHLFAIFMGVAVPVAIELGTMPHFQSVAHHSMSSREAALSEDRGTSNTHEQH